METVVYVCVRGCQVCAGQVEANRNALTLDGRAVHDFELVEVFCLGDCILAVAHNFLLDYAQLHVLDLNAHQVEEDLAQDTVFEVELAKVEFKLDVQALLDAHLHLDRPVLIWLRARVSHYELLFLGYPVVVSVDYHVDVVPQPYHDSIVAFILLFNPVELEVVLYIVCQGPRWLKVSDYLEKRGILGFVVKVLDDADELDSDAQVVDALALVEGDGYLPFYVFPILNLA